jgi:hypothetical protein
MISVKHRGVVIKKKYNDSLMQKQIAYWKQVEGNSKIYLANSFQLQVPTFINIL